jgi:hypothetical protein
LKSGLFSAEPWCGSGIDKSSAWLATVNAAYLGEYLDRDTAMARVESDIKTK